MKKKDHQEASSEEPISEIPAADAESVRLREERDRLDEQLKRTMADLANIRRRHVKELEEARSRAIEAMAGELLPVLDNFQLALAAHEQHETGAARGEAHSMVEGLKMVRSLLQGVLERHGLVEIDAAGAVFDANVHEAVGIDTQTAVESGRVSRVMLPGYSFRDRVLRPSKVHVAGELSGGPPPADSGDQEG